MRNEQQGVKLLETEKKKDMERNVKLRLERCLKNLVLENNEPFKGF